MLNKLRVRAKGESGFTLVELLVVMLILGLLAAIAIPAFFNQRDKARDSEAKSAVRTAQTSIETYATDNDGSYAGAVSDPTGADPNSLQAVEESLENVGARLEVESTSPTGYVIRVFSETDPAAQWFRITRTGGTTSLTCEATGTAGCPGNGNWG